MLLEKLKQELLTMKRVAISFSGGIDSTLLAYCANDILGKDNVLLVIIDSELHKREDAQNAVAIAKYYGWQYVIKDIQELDSEAIRNNHTDSWYHSKMMLYQAVIDSAKENGIESVCDGMILDDLKDYRPGLKARDELGVISPLVLAGFAKPDVRQLAKALGITIWNQASSCSLISRFPYNSTITLEAIQKVKAVEKLLEAQGYENARARYYQSMVKLEIPFEKIQAFFAASGPLKEQIKVIGFKNVALDLDGYHYGNMNNTLKGKEVSG
ncbi:ATP-dependent sacrificial sulfur transferase LarE [Tuanshanicoccus lijuaniae]|uniref:ATP-dependent sacrificial sulfur transferase LarE n=1 Tax=Aerococcaceae bacterium zg-1292 TaxID=2774330 RepID=UPI001BD8CEF6|nr:ATP-dependent sacrificial sulfur transferase LarE [Aerococcaceae bacterium zg-A91]MBS4458329.1 ATP-dependent sacrificial sulfur transferase LarE [Aerococcaceae bacterium zg-BR33]